jgi:dTDP-4-amino-4,6-dideoxygalactose transaminase
VTADRVYLSPPHMTDVERDLLLQAFDSNWIAPVGPDLAAFEGDIARWTGRPHAVALASGTAGLHLAMLLVGVEPGDEVLVPSFTFVATANAVLQAGGAPTFVDSEAESWNIDPDLVAETLAHRATAGRLPAAVVAVDLYGQCADYARLEPVCAEFGVPLVVDAAEALGASRDGRAAGSQGAVAVVSFNGNKIITTGGGGALVADDPALTDRARHLATQAREPAAHYEHVDAGFNYRMSNLLAALGRGQLQRLPEMMARRAGIHECYRSELGDLPGIGFMPVPDGSEPNRWLTVMTVDPTVTGTDREALRLALEAEDIEARPAWKPMHLQPLFADAEMVGGAVSEAVFADGLCLPSGSSLRDDELDRTIAVLLGALGH